LRITRFELAPYKRSTNRSQRTFNQVSVHIQAEWRSAHHGAAAKAHLEGQRLVSVNHGLQRFRRRAQRNVSAVTGSATIASSKTLSNRIFDRPFISLCLHLMQPKIDESPNGATKNLVLSIAQNMISSSQFRHETIAANSNDLV
jgi:hypothetical protein